MDEGAFVEESGKAESPPETIDLIVKTATRRTWKGLAKERIENTKPSIPLGRSFWLCSKPNELDNLIASESVLGILTSTLTRQEDVAVTVADAAFWKKGCSSLGFRTVADLAHSRHQFTSPPRGC
jgi:hypothetical protein